jgi:hypothetical protein
VKMRGLYRTIRWIRCRSSNLATTLTALMDLHPPHACFLLLPVPSTPIQQHRNSTAIVLQ